MNTKELMKQIRMIQKKHDKKEIIIKIGSIENGKYTENELILQNIVESNYDGKTFMIFMK